MMVDGVLMTAAELARAVGGELLGPDLPIASVAIDSRAVERGALFVALLGTERDGHDYAAAAFAAGAVAALVLRSRVPACRAAAEKTGGALVAVADTLKALQQASGYYLDRFPHLRRIGITGSSGKTTTKELAAAMIGAERSVVLNEGNLNSETGLPLSVFKTREGHEVGVFELGMNRRGEIGELAAVLRPQLALITNIGSAHIGILGTREAIAEEKKTIFSQFSGTEIAFVAEDDPFAEYLAAGIRGTVKRFGPRSLAAFGGARSAGLDGTDVEWAGETVRFRLPGEHNLKNALAAAALAEEIGVSADAIRAALADAKPLFGRAEIFRGAVTVVQDCYNANPESMDAAIEFCDQVDWPGRKIFVIGSMLELGALADVAHRALGARLASSSADAVYFFGEETHRAFEILSGKKTCGYFTDIDAITSAVVAETRSGDMVLLKGSRGTALERLTKVLVPAMGKERS